MITPLSNDMLVTDLTIDGTTYRLAKHNTVADNRNKINEIIAYINRKLPDDNISSWETIAAEWKKLAQEALAELKALKESK